MWNKDKHLVPECLCRSNSRQLYLVGIIWQSLASLASGCFHKAFLMAHMPGI